MSTVETPEEALQRIQSLGFGKNDAAVIVAFSDRGIDPEQIDPRHNVLTFRAWKAVGRRVARGAISVRVTTWIPCQERGGAESTGEGEDRPKSRMRPKAAYLFHESQTVAKDAEKGTAPDAWDNPQLVKEGTYEDGPSRKGFFVDDSGKCHAGVELVQPLPTQDGFKFGGFTNNPEQPDVDDNGRLQASLADVKPERDDFGKSGEERPGECNCPMVGVMTNVDCPIHGGR